MAPCLYNANYTCSNTKQRTVLKPNLGGDEMGKQDDVMILQSSDRGKRMASASLSLWAERDVLASRIIQEFHLLGLAFI